MSHHADAELVGQEIELCKNLMQFAFNKLLILFSSFFPPWPQAQCSAKVTEYQSKLLLREALLLRFALSVFTQCISAKKRKFNASVLIWLLQSSIWLLIPPPGLRFCWQELVIDTELAIDMCLQTVLFLCDLGSCRGILTAMFQSPLKINIFKNYRIALHSLQY